MDDLFERLEAARIAPKEGKPRGHTVKEVCDILGVAEITYYKWKKNGCSPRPGTEGAIERYIAEAK